MKMSYIYSERTFLTNKKSLKRRRRRNVISFMKPGFFHTFQYKIGVKGEWWMRYIQETEIDILQIFKLTYVKKSFNQRNKLINI